MIQYSKKRENFGQLIKKGNKRLVLNELQNKFPHCAEGPGQDF